MSKPVNRYDHDDIEDELDMPVRTLRRVCVAACVIILLVIAGWCATASAATNLAVVTRDPAVAGKLVKDVSATVVYATPLAGDYLRVATAENQVWVTGVWKAFPLAPGEMAEVCTSDVAEETNVNATSGACTGWAVATPGAALNKTGTLDVTWAPPTFGDGAEGHPPKASDLIGYKLYSGVKGGTPGFIRQVAPGVLSTTLTGYGNGIYTIGVTALYRAGTTPPIAPLESPMSPTRDVEVSIPLPVAPLTPGTPGQPSITGVRFE